MGNLTFTLKFLFRRSNPAERDGGGGGGGRRGESYIGRGE